jgi:UDP-N-acetylmuramoyl-L-alanyl-D-glutamate--2,6-diaminopimelate ligase
LALHGADAEASSLALRAQDAEPGALFIALPGARGHGLEWAAQAGERGAVAVLSDRPCDGLPTLVHPDPRSILSRFSLHFYGNPERSMALAGITGTKGKTTTAHLVHHALALAGPAGFLGTTHYQAGPQRFPSPYTTPEAPVMAAMMRRMADAGVREAVMEVSSHALALGRVEGLAFRAAAFLNLGRDHMDFHPTVEDYFAAKRRIFDHLEPDGTAVLNQGDARVRGIELPGRRVLTFGHGPGADIHPKAYAFSERGTEGTLVVRGAEVPLRSTLFGLHNLENILAAAAILTGMGRTPEAAAEAIASFPGVPGRLERVDAGQRFPVLVDYAHTPEGFRLVLDAVRGILGKKIITVFGCGGDRDKGKRPLMGEAAGRLSDIVILTTDNPRSEDPAQICREIAEGVFASGQQKVLIVLDRAEAIRKAVQMANANFAVLLLGKGHEEYQIVGTVKHPFSDRDEARKALEELAR